MTASDHKANVRNFIGVSLIERLFDRRNIAQLTLEGLVVVASILIAFALDAWIASGHLGGLDSRILRQRLASVRGKVEDVVEEVRRLRGETPGPRTTSYR
jgi:hypothetical protein